MCVKLDKINETQEEQRQNILPFSFQIFFGTEYFDSSLWTVYFVSNSYVDLIILKDGIQMKDFTCCEEKRICFIFLGEYLRALGFLASVEDVVKCPRVGFLWEVPGHTSTGCSVAMCSPTGASWRMTKMSEEIPDVTWLYLHKFMFEYLLWTGSNMKHTGPEVVHVDRDIFNPVLSKAGQESRFGSRCCRCTWQSWISELSPPGAW